MKRIFIINPEKDQQLLSHALNNSNITTFNQEFDLLEIGKDLADKICQIIAESFQEAKKLGKVSSHYRETSHGTYRSLVNSLTLK